MGGRDINGMKPKNWKQADVSKVLANVKIDKKDNLQLLDLIKLSLVETISVLRGTAQDDRVSNIVDLIMLRIHAALDSLSLDESESALETIQELIDLIQEKLDSGSEESGEVTDETIAELLEKLDEVVESISSFTEYIIEKISEITSSSSESASSVLQNTEESVKTSESEDLANIESGNNGNVETLKSDVLKQVLQAVDTSSLFTDNIKAIEQLTLINLKRIELLEAAGPSLAIPEDAPPPPSPDVEIVIQQQLKEMQVLILKIELQLTNVVLQAPAAQPAPADDGKKMKAKSKDMKTISKVLEESSNRLIWAVLFMDVKVGYLLELMNIGLDNIIDGIKKNLLKATDIIMYLGIGAMILGAMFFPKFRNFLANAIKKFITVGIPKILKLLWELICKISPYIWEALKFIGKNVWEGAKKLLANPANWVIDKFKKAYEILLDWGKSIKEFIFGKSEEIKENQDENEKKAEKATDLKLNDKIGELDCKISNRITKVDNEAGRLLQELNLSIQGLTQAISALQNELSNNVTENINEVLSNTKTELNNVSSTVTTTAKNMEAENEKISSTTLPQIKKGMEDSLNQANAKLDSKVNDKITATEKKLDDLLEETEKKMKAEGTPTVATPEALNKLELKSDGASFGDKIGDDVKTPDSIEATAIQEKNKNVLLYSDKKELAEARANGDELNLLNLSLNTNGPKPGIPKLSSRLTISTDSPDFKADMYEKYNKIIEDSEKMNVTFAEGNVLLKLLKAIAGRYYENVEKCLKICSDKALAATSVKEGDANITVVLSADGVEKNAALMESL